MLLCVQSSVDDIFLKNSPPLCCDFSPFFFVDSETPNSGGAARVSPSTISFRLGYSIRRPQYDKKKKKKIDSARLWLFPYYFKGDRGCIIFYCGFILYKTFENLFFSAHQPFK